MVTKDKVKTIKNKQHVSQDSTESFTYRCAQELLILIHYEHGDKKSAKKRYDAKNSSHKIREIHTPKITNKQREEKFYIDL